VFSAEFKAEAVRLMAERRAAGASVAQIGRELAVRPDLLRVWAKEQPAAAKAGGAVPGETLEQENRRLRRELATLQQEQAFLKKAAVGSTGERNRADYWDPPERKDGSERASRLVHSRDRGTVGAV
jgi:transposase